jgi:hypothetical protein
MTEDIEKKLNELLGLKKQMEELAADKKKTDTVSEFEGKSRKTKTILYIYLVICVGIMLIGVSGIEMNTGIDKKLIALFMAIVGFEGTVLMKLWFHITQNRLTILQEMKQMELRITELLQKK